MIINRFNKLIMLGIFIICLLTSFYIPSTKAAIDESNFDANGVNLHYIVVGKGEPVLLIHGFTSSAKANWQLTGVVDLLAKDYQVIAVDMPGHGMSDKPIEPQAYGLQLVEDIVLLMDHLKIKKAHIVGYSMGGMITMKMMAKHQDRVLSGLVGGFGWLKEGGFMQNAFQRPSRNQTTHLSICFNSLARLALTENELKSINVPVTVVVGDRDPVEKLYVIPLQQVRKDWPVTEIKGAGHITCVANPQFKEEVKNWLDKQTR